MATRSAIAIQETKEGPIQHIYCHFEGHPRHNGKILNEHFRDSSKVKELLALGDMSSLKPRLDESVFYHRDRKERLHINAPVSLKEFASDDSFDFRYLLKEDDDGSWNWYLIDCIYGAVESKLLKDALVYA
jgi:hypothetical protein